PADLPAFLTMVWKKSVAAAVRPACGPFADGKGHLRVFGTPFGKRLFQGFRKHLWWLGARYRIFAVEYEEGDTPHADIARFADVLCHPIAILFAVQHGGDIGFCQTSGHTHGDQY